MKSEHVSEMLRGVERQQLQVRNKGFKLHPKLHYSNTPRAPCRLQRVRTPLGYRERDTAQKKGRV